ncbi:MAG: host specificity factor TipJ family phage tail protein [Desulfobacterales bacterium]|jgi:hypothetical protein|nr:host specificity factor TipJ family phage tail protein [Desulfobacterales bacterium]MCU0601285.1 host specificity factor TipJ family phage tail protein [Desulfobacterales bacterium]
MDMLRIIGMIAIVAASIYVPGAIGLTGPWAAAAGAATAFSGSLLLNAIVPPQQPKINSYSSSPTYSLTGMRNVSEPYGPITRIFGRHITYPKYAAKPYTELVGSEQYLRCLFLIAKGRYVLSDHKIGETPIGNFTDVQMEQYYSGGSNHFALFPSDVNEEALSVALTAAGSWQSRTTAPDTDEISFDISFPSGLYDINSGGNRSPETVVFEIQYAVSGSGNWINFGISKDLFFSGLPSSGIAAGQSVVGQSSGAVGTVRYAHRNSTGVDTGETNDNGQQIYNLVQYTDWIRVEESSGHFIAGENVLIAGSVTAAVASLTDLGSQVSINAQHNELFRYGFTIKVPRGTWDLRIRRTTTDGRANTVDASYWTALRSISYEAPWNLAGCTLIGLRIKASGQLNGVIDQFNCIAEAIVPAHDGTSWTDVKTRNPAWAFCEVLRGTSNERPVPDSRLDLAAIRAWAANCDTAGRTFDAVIDFKTSVRDLCQDICTVGRASRGMVNGAYTVIEDKVQSTPRQHFTQRNCWGFSGGVAFPDRPHALKIRFFDAASNYTQVERIVPDDGYTEATATKFETLDLFGCTDADQAWKWGRYMIACARLRAERWEINADFEHLRCTRGDMVLLSHDAISVGLGAGRVVSMTTGGGNILTVTFDDVFPMGASGTYGFRYRTATGADGSAVVARVEGDNYTVTLSPAIPVASGLAVGDLCSFGEAASETVQALVQRIMPGKNFTARICLIPYSPAVLTADSGAIPAYDSGITVPPVDNRLPAAPNIVSTSYSIKDGSLADDGTVGVLLVVVFEATSGFSQTTGGFGQAAPDVIQGFQAQWRLSGNAQWQDLPVLPGYARRFTVDVKNDASYDVRVRSFSLPGLYSAWDTESEIAVALSGTTPADVSGLQVVGGGTSFLAADCPIEWTPVTGGGTAGLLIEDYQVEVRTSDGLTILRTVYVADARYTYSFADNLADGGPRASLQFRVKARSRWGDLSAAAASLTATNPAPGNPQGLGSRSFMGGVEFYWTANSEADFSHFLQRLKVASGGTWGAWQRTDRTGIERLLSGAEKDAHGADAEIYFEVKAVDVFGQESGSLADSEICGSLNVKESDIDDFAVSASKVFNKIPVVQGLSLTDNSPAAGRVAWNDCTVYYNGVAYPILSGDTPATDQKYIYWKDLSNSFATSATHPASIAGWVPGEDFIIAVNVAGVGQAAWNALANQVIGSAYIENLGVLDAHIQSISGTKIQATSAVAIGSATFGNLGIQFEYNGGAPRFYAGNGSQDYIKYAAGVVEINSGGAANAVRLSGGVVSIKSATFGADGIQLDYNGADPRFYCGDGSNNYIKFDGTNAEFSSSRSDAVVIKSGGNIKLEGDNSQPGKVVFAGSSYSTYMGVNGAGTLMSIKPVTDEATDLIIGGDPTYIGILEFLNIYIGANTKARVFSQGTSELASYNPTRHGKFLTYANPSNGYCQIVTKHDGANERSYMFAGETMYPGENKVYYCGMSSYAWDHVYSDDFDNVADFLHLDTLDDLAVLHGIKGSGQVDPETGHELINDDTLPDWLLARTRAGAIERDPDGKPYIRLKVLLSLLMGACRQLDGKIAAVGAARRA